MGSVKVAVALAMLAALLMVQFSYATVYKVGDSAGWTTIGNIDYKQWSATKTFKIGDVILFQYSAQFHNVMRVTHKMYKACNTSSPLATYTTGNDSITIKNHGHHFFFCGVPGHCQAGQKIDINVLRIKSDQLAPTPSALPPPDSSSVRSAKAPGPSSSNATPFRGLDFLAVKLGLMMVIFSAFVSNYV